VRCCYNVTRARFSFLFCEDGKVNSFVLVVFAVKKAHERREVKEISKKYRDQTTPYDTCERDQTTRKRVKEGKKREKKKPSVAGGRISYLSFQTLCEKLYIQQTQTNMAPKEFEAPVHTIPVDS
jgi:hypothetical protein